jgi:alcohol dehydrogenase class IV
VTDPGLKRTTSFARVAATLQDAEVFADVHPNPTGQDVEAATGAMIENDCDGVVAIGGGSALDVGKLIRLRRELRDGPLATLGDAKIDKKLAPLIAIPTTAGTGSEVGRSSVITFGDTKKVIFAPALLADLVLLDPELTVELPVKLTAATGADALTHCIESFTSTEFHPLCEGIALEGVHLIVDALPRAVHNPTDLDARGKMQVAAMMGGIAFQKELGAAHSLAHPLSALAGVHHGLANALVLPAVMRFNAQRKPGVYHRVGIAMGLSHSSDADTIAAVEKLLRDIGIEFGLRSAGVKGEQLDALADQAIADGCHKTNPVPVTRDDLRRLYQEAM